MTETIVCRECGRTISAKEQYDHVIEDRGGGTPTDFKTCVDCRSIKYLYWPPPDHGSSSLTSTAMDKICEMLNEYWGNHAE